MLKQAKEICPTTTIGKVKEGALIVDVRNTSEVEKVTFDVPNYMNIPLNELEDRINEIPKDKEIVMVCRSGERSLKTTYFLMNAGYENVSNMRDGIIKWASKGFPTKGNVEELLNGDSCDCSQPNCC
ncbi:MAG: rhodanese-like domain-containing protein [Flavobacteriales bacterium]